VFDLYLLDTQLEISKKEANIGKETLKKAVDNALSIEYSRFKDTVLSYFTEEDRRVYGDPGRWDDIRLAVCVIPDFWSSGFSMNFWVG
jgi:CRISPR/Cas system CMR-associated protein Cmr3 (group 5 of RAMP superfamily)